jgi:hypothetical protein
MDVTQILQQLQLSSVSNSKHAKPVRQYFHNPRVILHSKTLHPAHNVHSVQQNQAVESH